MTEEKVRFQMRISPDTDRKIKAAMPLVNCRSQNEFVEQAIRFYCAYVATKDTSDFLPSIYLSAMRATIHESENRICRLLFKLAVELDMTMNVIAAGMEIPQSDLEHLRGRCVRNVKSTNGSVNLNYAIRYQNGEIRDSAAETEPL